MYYYLSTVVDVDIKVFELFQKLHLLNLCKSIHGTIHYFTFICPFEPGEYGKGKKLQKCEYLKSEKKIIFLKDQKIYVLPGIYV